MPNPERGNIEKAVDTVGKVEVGGGLLLAVLGADIGVPIFLFGAGKLVALHYWDKRKQQRG